MKQFLHKTVLLLCALIAGSGTMWGQAAVNTVLWSETWTGATTGTSAGDSYTPSVNYGKGTTVYNSGTVTYAQSANSVYVRNDTYAGGTAPELMLTSGQTWTISNIPTGGAIDLTLTYKSNNTKSSVTCSTKGASISGSSKSYTITTGGAETITLVFGCSGNTRIDNVELKVKTAGSSSSAETTTTTIDASGITNTNKYVSTAAGSLSASVVYGSPAASVPEASVTWSGNNDAVATINATTGAVTLVGAGVVTFTATYDGVEDEYFSSSDTYEMTVTNEDPSLVEIWSENFSSYDEDDVPSGGDYSYVCTDGTKTSGSTAGGTTAVKNENLAGGAAALELLVGKKGSGTGAVGGTFTATIPLLAPTYAYSGDLTLKYKTNANALNVKTTTDDITVDGEDSEGAGITYSTSGEHTITFKGVTASTESITIVFTATTSSNVRLDDILLKGKQVAVTKAATPVILPADGTVVISGTEVTLSCLTEGVSIYYTMGADPADPTSSSTLYDSSSKPTITEATTIKAIAIKDGLTDSEIASASYTIAAPCATPTFSVVEGVVEKGTTVTLSCETDDATIYYTTDGSTPTTSSSVYSSAITINATQTIQAIAAKDGMANSAVASATYTVRDFVNLPFSFNNGKSSIDTTTGLTQSGLGSDYGSSAYTKLKFDDTGDYVIVKFNASPVVLTYSITGNTFSGGTFKLQYSADGSSYTDLKSYTSLSGSTTNEALYNIPTSARYIKWVYTFKSSGNVGLGNIKLVEAEQVTIGATGYTTHVTTNKLSFPTDMKAYIVTATESSYVTLSEVAKVPADEAIILNATAGTYNLPVTESVDDVSGNLLQASDGSVEGDDNTIFALGVGKVAPYEGVVGFYLVNGGQKVPAGKAYLEVAAPGPGVKGFTFNFDDATAIAKIQDSGSKIQDSEIFNLAGQKMSKLQKGLNIVNGKKVLVK